MTLTSWFLQTMSNEDRCTDLIEYVLIATVLTLGVIATYGTLTYRIGMEFTSIASRI